VLEPADNNGGTIITRAITPIDESYSTSFEYNADGIRTKKIWCNPITDATTTTEYKLSGTTILSETTTGAYTRTIRYIYTNNELVGFEYNGNAYYYRKNLFGDIVEVYDSENNLVASYTYDAWGNCTFGANIDNIANVNPFRYRGYYYDWETRYYYLQTRYYDAEVGRFINADSIEYLDPERIHGCNLYTYCLNNPVMAVDPIGTFGIITAFAILGIFITIVSVVVYISDTILIAKETEMAIKQIETDVALYATYKRAGKNPDDYSFYNKYYEEYLDFCPECSEKNKHSWIKKNKECNHDKRDLPSYRDLIAQLASNVYHGDYASLSNKEIADGAELAVNMSGSHVDDFRIYMASRQVRGVLEVVEEFIKSLKNLFR